MKTCPQCHMRYPDEGQFCFVEGATLVPLHDPRIGTTVAGRYLIEEVIGEGGMAMVYRARHKLVDRPCAVKLLDPGLARDATVRERFRREAKSAQVLAHPNIIEIFDQGDTEDTSYIVMELLTGSALAEVIGQGPMPVERAVSVMIQMCRGIARAHDLGVIHRDLKPENIFLCRREDGSELVKILDFGIARSRADARLTNQGELFGTPQYLAPERVQSGDAGPNVDLYALGVIFFEMVTGRLPFDGADITTFLVKHLKEPAPPPSKFVASLPPELDRLIVQLLQKDPKARPVDAHRISRELMAIAHKYRLRVPVDVEEDPASQRPPAKTIPSITQHQWMRRTAVFTQMLAQAFGATPPPDLKRMLVDLTQLVSRVAELRQAAMLEQRKLEQIDQRGREGRQRFGFAVDALGIDLSKAKDEARSAHARAEGLREGVEAAAKRFAELQREILTWEGRSGFREPYPQLAEAYRSCAAAVDDWLGHRTVEKSAQTDVETRDRVVVDLEYQIGELRAALAAHEAGIERDRAAEEQTIIEMNRQAEALDTALVQLATRFCEPLRGKPELGPLFRELEASDVVAA